MNYLNNILKNPGGESYKSICFRGSFAYLLLFFMGAFAGSAQQLDPKLSESNGYVFEGNSIVEDDFIAAEKKYRLAVSTKQDNATGSFNLGNAYYKSELYDEALLRHLEAVENSSSKSEKHKAYHNIGNILMQKKQCKEAVSAFKNALRNKPSDDESRYNLALAQECAKEQGDGDGDGDDEDKDKDKDENKDDKDDSDEKQDKDEKNKDKGDDEDKNEGDDKEDEDGKPKDDKGDQKNKNPKDDKGQPQQQPGKLSPQQVKNLLEAMNNEEKKVQEKMNASKTKGVKVKTEKDW
ncbi:aerotolerance regulator BatC [Flavobacteriaceae bacterium]|jgi:Ca-activated chloride channel family protein|nr:aerotolerance regulator BatC [Flavobacteriaceae bacterium]MDA7724071.1 aerotolerance regulator BatC [Flavobacteriaceae bacterium]MDA7727556.1 aerotolerance regulator BatC [Flavobacteriaceae bacterium]